MNSIRLYLVAAAVLLCTAIATLQTGADQFAGASAAKDLPAAPEDGGPRNWQVTGVSGALNLRGGGQPTTAAKIINTYPPGTILDNLGFQRADGRIWCDVQQLGGGPSGYVAAEYLAPAVSPDGSVATGPDNSAFRAGQGDFDATGQIPCAQYPGQPMTECEFGVARAGGGYATVVILLPRTTSGPRPLMPYTGNSSLSYHPA